jgi:biopolymer transport protein ExbB/TolQ
MEELIVENQGIFGVLFALISMVVVGLFAKSFHDMFTFGKKVSKVEKESIKNHEKFIETKAKNEQKKNKIIEKQAQREAEISQAVEIVPDEIKNDIDEISDSLSKEWNSKFGKGD